MKKKTDPRHMARKEVAQHLFEWIFLHDVTDGNAKTRAVVENIPHIDAVITKCAPQWPLDQINKVDLSVLRLAFYELFFEPDTPQKVVIDEAIEIGKELGTDSSGSFINGVMGNVMNNFEQYKNEVKRK